jgi:hypothetical protein
MWTGLTRCFLLALALLAAPDARANDPHPMWVQEFPKTDFANASVDFSEILSGGPPRDGIPAIDDPAFTPLGDVEGLSETEPVIGLVINGEAKAYPLRILIWHEIVNDELGGVPVAVTYCPLCNSAVVFDRRLEGRILTFGTTGRLRKSDLVMYDRETETWWQQFLGEGIIGAYTGTRLTAIPARLESLAHFRKRAPDGLVLVPNGKHHRDYGRNPYVMYDTQNAPYALFQGDLPDYINPMARVVVAGGKAWSLALLRERGTIQDGKMLLTWSAGQNSALHKGDISEGRDVGNVTVEINGSDAVYDVTFAFVYHAFHPDKRIRTE